MVLLLAIENLSGHVVNFFSFFFFFPSGKFLMGEEDGCLLGAEGLIPTSTRK